MPLLTLGSSYKAANSSVNALSSFPKNPIYKTYVKNSATPEYSPIPLSSANLRGMPSSTTDGITVERRTQHLVVAKERRKGYLFSTPDFAARAEELRSRAMKVEPAELRLMPLSRAAEIWWAEVKQPTVRKERTKEAYSLYLKNIKDAEIGKVQISQLHLGHLLEYQNDRKKVSCVSYVNHETNVISQVLSYCDMWEFIGKHFKPLPQPDWRPPKVLTHEEEEKFFRVVAGKSEWQVAYWAVSLTNNTSAAGSEIRTLQLQHVFIAGEWEQRPKIHIPDTTAKNQFRARVIPLNEIALKQVERLLERARRLGAHLPEHYLFPKRLARNRYDIEQPASRSYIRHAFNEMREATGLTWLQPRNFRNQLITKLFENGTPDETITAIAGHQSINMSKYYSQIRLDAKRDALSAIVSNRKGVKNVG